jgi:Bacterial PH domain
MFAVDVKIQYVIKKHSMKKVYKSKIGLELAVPLMLIFGTVLFLTMSEKPSWIGVSILLPVMFFATHMFMTTNYTVTGDSLTIKCGFLFHKTIDIKTISKISETNNPLSSPATSLDRLEIIYGKFDSVLISPKLKKEFIDEIILINPMVEVVLKTKGTS